MPESADKGLAAFQREVLRALADAFHDYERFRGLPSSRDPTVRKPGEAHLPFLSDTEIVARAGDPPDYKDQMMALCRRGLADYHIEDEGDWWFRITPSGLREVGTQDSPDALTVLTDLQTSIMAELGDNAKTAKQLADILKRPHATVRDALLQLRRQGRVRNRRGLGYYRPDAPPPSV